jgi:hypothetical protein
VRLRRRTVLAAGIAVALSGCVEENDPDGGTAPVDTTPTDTGTHPQGGGLTDTTEPPTGEPSRTDTADLDLREANVTAVELDPGDDQTFEVSVTLFHDDDGEEGYANWWQAETLDGERLSRRDLTHAHGTREFTRSADIDVPEEVSCIVVRGHDQTHEYGGQAMLVNTDSGATALKRQGPDRAAFVPADCP